MPCLKRKIRLSIFYFAVSLVINTLLPLLAMEENDTQSPVLMDDNFQQILENIEPEDMLNVKLVSKKFYEFLCQHNTGYHEHLEILKDARSKFNQKSIPNVELLCKTEPRSWVSKVTKMLKSVTISQDTSAIFLNLKRLAFLYRATEDKQYAHEYINLFETMHWINPHAKGPYEVVFKSFKRDIG